MIKPITGQYECLHRSGVGLDYFTSRIDRLILQPNGRFTFIVQDRSRIANAAQSLVSGQQVSTTTQETRREGNYTSQDNNLLLHFDDGAQEQGQLSWNGDGVQIGANFFNKVSNSTLLPPTHRMQKDMEDIAKGLKIAGTIGSLAIKAAKGIHETIQTIQGPEQSQPPTQQAAQSAPPQPIQNAAPPPAQPAPQPSVGSTGAIFCDQCGTRCRPGKRFCNNCGAPLV